MKNCEMSFICSQQWAKLKEGEKLGVRHCESCKTDVFLVNSSVEFEQHKSQGHCVAFFLDCEVISTMGLPDIGSRAELGFDPLLQRPLSELEDLPAELLKTLQDNGLENISDIIVFTQVQILELLRDSYSDLNTLNEILSGLNLTFGMQLGERKR